MGPLLMLFALLGHAFLWIGVINRLHAFGIRRKTIKIITVGCFACAAAIPLAVGMYYATHRGQAGTALFADNSVAGFLASVYVVICRAIAVITLLRLALLRLTQWPRRVVRFFERRRAAIDLASAAASNVELRHHWATYLPRNEILQLDVTRLALDMPRLAPALDGLSIVHLSDLHFTGRVGKAYFREVVRTSNELQPDLVCITGDIVDQPACLPWIAETIGQLAARYGVYFILGNHDRRVDAAELRRLLEGCGMIDLGGRWLVVDIRGTPVVMAGNECPWFGPAADLASCPLRSPTDPLRIVLSHSPDQLAWARSHNIDLMLAGHTHGGQIRIPPLGAIFSPAASGVKHVAGVFHAPPTILHVTRGVSGDIPIRWNCRPEIAWLTLRSQTA